MNTGTQKASPVDKSFFKLRGGNIIKNSLIFYEKGFFVFMP